MSSKQPVLWWFLHASNSLSNKNVLKNGWNFQLISLLKLTHVNHQNLLIILQARTLRAPAGMRRRKTWSTCYTVLAWRRGSTWANSCLLARLSANIFKGRPHQKSPKHSWDKGADCRNNPTQTRYLKEYYENREHASLFTYNLVLSFCLKKIAFSPPGLCKILTRIRESAWRNLCLFTRIAKKIDEKCEQMALKKLPLL